MNTFALLTFILLAAGVSLVYVHGQSPCQSSFVNAFYQCLSNRSLDKDHFLWLARDGQMGTPPADIPVFTERVCIEKQGLHLCAKSILGKVQSLSEGQCLQTQKDSIGSLARQMFTKVNKQCQHPCRQTFKQTLEKCFTDRNFGSPEFLIFNMTTPRDSILGTNQPEIERFCRARPDIISCLKMAAGVCDDSRILLRSYGLDLDSLDLTYILLCNSSALYRDASDCYRNLNIAVVQCRNILSANMAALETQLADMNITESMYRDQTCLQRASQFQCELTTMVPRNDSVKCSNPAVLGLRRQQECSLFPLECRINNQATVDTLCQPAEFHIPERQFYTAASIRVPARLEIVAVAIIMPIFALFPDF